jgi:hypothetical protein
VPTNPVLLPAFRKCLLGIVARYTLATPPGSASVASASDHLTNSQPSEWLALAKTVPIRYEPGSVLRMFFVFVHASVSPIHSTWHRHYTDDKSVSPLSSVQSWMQEVEESHCGPPQRGMERWELEHPRPAP